MLGDVCVNKCTIVSTYASSMLVYHYAALHARHNYWGSPFIGWQFCPSLYDLLQCLLCGGHSVNLFELISEEAYLEPFTEMDAARLGHDPTLNSCSSLDPIFLPSWFKTPEVIPHSLLLFFLMDWFCL